jgi:hypothetical protein
LDLNIHGDCLIDRGQKALSNSIGKKDSTGQFKPKNILEARARKAKLLTGVAVLLLSAAHAYSEEPLSIMNPLGIARSRYAGEWNCGMNMKLIMDKGKQKLDTKITCVDKNSGKFMAGFDEYLILTPKKNSPWQGRNFG